MEFGNDNDIFKEESDFIEIKTEMDDFLRTLNDPFIDEFRTQFLTYFQNYQSSFSGVSMLKRHLIEIQEKLKKNVRNKNEVIKNIDDDTERYGSLKNEFENFYYKIDEKKFEEIFEMRICIS